MKLKAQLEGSDISQNAALWLMTGLILLAFLLAAIGSDWDTISTDELNSISSFGAFDHANGVDGLIGLAPQYLLDQMPLYYIGGALWGKAAGYSPTALRLLGALIGLLAVAWLYRLGTDLFDRRVALLAALLFCTSAKANMQLHHIRMYALVALLATLHTWLYWRLSRRGKGGRKTWLALVATCALLLYTQGFTGVFFLGLCFCHVLFGSRSMRWRMAIQAWALGLALFLPYAPTLLEGAAFAGKYGNARSLNAIELAIVLGLELVNQMAILWLPLACGIWLRLRRRRRGAMARLLFIALAIAAGLAAIDSVIQIIDWNRMRYFLMIWHFAMIVFAVALWSLPWRRFLLPLFVAIWIYGGMRASQPGFEPDHPYVVSSPYRLPPLHDYVRTLSGKVSGLDYVVGFQESGLVHIEAETLGATFTEYYLNMQLGIDGLFFHKSDKKYRLKGDVGDILTTRPHLLLAHDPSAEPPNYGPSRHFIEEQFAPCPPVVDEPRLRIQRFRHPAISCDHAPASTVVYDNGMRLIDRAVRYDGDTNAIQALLWWEIPDESMLDDFNISLQVFDSNGDKAAQNDYHLDANLTPWGVAKLPLGDLPDGDYQLKLILYNRHDGAKVSGVDEATGDAMALLRLHDFEAAR